MSGLTPEADSEFAAGTVNSKMSTGAGKWMLCRKTSTVSSNNINIAEPVHGRYSVAVEVKSRLVRADAEELRGGSIIDALPDWDGTRRSGKR